MKRNQMPTHRVKERAIELLGLHPNGLRYTDLWDLIYKSDPDLNYSTIGTQIWHVQHDSRVEHKKGGVYRLADPNRSPLKDESAADNPLNAFLSAEGVAGEDKKNVYQEDKELQTFDIEPHSLSELPLNTDSRSLVSWYEENERRAATLDISELARRAAMASPVPRTVQLSSTTVYVRDPYVGEYAKKLAKGDCDLCTNPAPFLTANAEPYLESHHVIWLSRGGYDLINNVVALCPNCHRKMHSRDENTDRENLLYLIANRNQQSFF